MKQTGYIEWIERSFPECEVRIMSDLLIESIAVVQLFVVPGDERCQVVRTDSVRSPVVHSDQEAFFDRSFCRHCPYLELYHRSIGALFPSQSIGLTYH